VAPSHLANSIEDHCPAVVLRWELSTSSARMVRSLTTRLRPSICCGHSGARSKPFSGVYTALIFSRPCWPARGYIPAASYSARPTRKPRYLPAMEDGLCMCGLAGVVGELNPVSLTPSRRLTSQIMPFLASDLAARLKRPSCGSRRVALVFRMPKEPQSRRASVVR
jgi:hypothetical protein